ncbi:unnamed protein product [Amoebophrya sp. A120]|nr:unnamed protein product [Amoebophrya sp. A120]|eukprot:GSA120T00008581001.1
MRVKPLLCIFETRARQPESSSRIKLESRNCLREQNMVLSLLSDSVSAITHWLGPHQEGVVTLQQPAPPSLKEPQPCGGWCFHDFVEAFFNVILSPFLGPSTTTVDPIAAAYVSGICVSLMSFVGVVTIGLLNIDSIKGPVEYLSLSFAGSALAGDALMHLLPECYGAHSHEPAGSSSSGGDMHDHKHDDHHDHGAGGDCCGGVMYYGLMAAIGGIALLLLDGLVDHDHDEELTGHLHESHSARDEDHLHYGDASPRTTSTARGGRGGNDGSPTDQHKMRSASSDKTKMKQAKGSTTTSKTTATLQQLHNQPKIKSFGLANLIVEIVHNFVDGLAIGVAFTTGNKLSGFNTTLAIVLHEIPQELGDFMVLRLAGFPTKKLLFWNFLVSLSTLVGIFLSTTVLQLEQMKTVKKTLVAVTAGSFLSLSFYMIFPQVKKSIFVHTKSSTVNSSRKLAMLYCGIVSFFALFLVYQVGVLEESAAHGGHDHGHDHHGHGHDNHHDHHHELAAASAAHQNHHHHHHDEESHQHAVHDAIHKAHLQQHYKNHAEQHRDAVKQAVEAAGGEENVVHMHHDTVSVSSSTAHASTTHHQQQVLEQGQQHVGGASSATTSEQAGGASVVAPPPKPPARRDVYSEL